MASIGDLVVQLTADTGGFDKGIGGMVDKLGGLGAIGLAGAVAAAGAAIGAFVNASVEHVKALDNEMIKFQVNTGATADQAAVFSNQLRELYRGNTDSIDDLAAAATMVTQRFGEQGDALAATTQDFLDFAKVTGTNTVDAIDAMADIMAKLGDTGEDTVEIMDALVAVAQKTGTPIGELQDALRGGATQFAAMGFTGQQAVAMLGALSSAGLDAGMMVKALNGFLDDTKDLTDKKAEALEHLGVSLNHVAIATDKTVKAAAEHGIELREGERLSDEMRKTLLQLGVGFDNISELAGTQKEALEELFHSLAGGEVDIDTMNAMVDVFGKKIGPELAAAISTGGLALDDFMDLVANSEGTVARASEVYDKQLGERWELLRRKYMEPFMNFIGDFFVKAIHMIIDVIEVVAENAEKAFQFLLTAFRNMGGSMGDTGKNLRAALTAVFNALSAVAVAAFTLIVATWENVLKPALDLLAPVFRAVFDSVRIIVDGGIKIITSLLNALAALLTGDFVGAWEHTKDVITTVLDVIKAVVTRIFDGITEYLSGVFALIFDTAKTQFENVQNAISTIVTNIQTNINNIFDDIRRYFTQWMLDVLDLFFLIWTSIFDHLVQLWENMRSEADTRFEAMRTIITNILNTLKTFIETLWESIKTAVTRIVEELKNEVTATWNALTSALPAAMEEVKTALENVWNATSTAASTIWATVANAVMHAFDAIPQFFSGLWSSITDGAKSALNSVIEIINGVLSKWNSISFAIPEIEIPEFTVFGQTFGGGSFGGGAIGVPQVGLIPGLAAGGLVRGPTLAMVGEAGPELITPLDRLGEFMGGGEQTIIVELDGRAIMQSVAPRMIDQIRLKTGFGNF